MILTTIRQRLVELGISQQELADRSELSLATIQNIESRRANPSIGTIEQLARTLNLELILKSNSCDWDELCFLGAPMMGQSPTGHFSTPTRERLIQLIRLASLDPEILENDRKKESLQSLLLAIHDHYPRIFKKYLSNQKFLYEIYPKEISGRLIKLRRIALAKISEYL